MSMQDVTIKRGQSLLLDSVSCAIEPGKLTVVLGPNGAGKTSLLRCLSGELAPDNGHVILQDKVLADWQPAQLAKHLAVLPQHSSLNFPFLVSEVVALGRIPHSAGAKRDGQIVAQMLEALDIAHLAQRDYTHLSGGEKQRVQLARVLSQIWDDAQHSMLLLDEPSNFLDLSHQRATMQLIASLTQRGASVLTVLHDFNLAARHADTILVVAKGKVVCEGAPLDVITAALMRDVFNVNARVFIEEEHGFPVVYTI